MSSLGRMHGAATVLPMVVAIGLGGCSADFAVSFCASEQQSISIDGFSSATTTQSAVSIAVGDSVRLVARGFCQGQGLRIAIGTRGTRWHSRDDSIVRVSAAPDVSDQAGTMASAWVVGLTPGATVVSGQLGETGASVLVNVFAR